MIRCLSLTAPKDARKLRDLQEYRKYIDAVEVRLDLCEFPERSFVQSVCSHAPEMVILSYRRPEDSSLLQKLPDAEASRIPEAKRLEVLTELLDTGVSHVDIEVGIDAPDLLRRAKQLNVKIIRSLHSFEGLPEQLLQLVREIASAGEIPKIAVYPRNSAEALQLLYVADALKDIKEKIVIGMGPYGFFGRVAPWLFGSMLTFTSVGEQLAAPGHIDPAQLEDVYHVSSNNDSTLLFGIIGNPVLHSRSPQLHNRWFREQGMNAVYLPFQVDDIDAFFELAEKVGIRGFSVTVPHKQEVISRLHSVSEEVRRIGSCNTVVRTERGWHGSNTDFEGFLRPLQERGEMRNMSTALVIGAGGAARTVVFALVQSGVKVYIVNRTAEKARLLAQEAGAQWVGLDAVSSIPESYKLVVQSTSVGMSPDTDADPLPQYRFRGDEMVYDIIYTPERSRFLQRAERAGCRTISGKGMLEAQAELQFELFRNSYNLLLG